jgi:chitin synthase
LINVRGESSSGKSESIQMTLRHLCDLSKSSFKKTKVQSNVLKVEQVLEMFGNASTPFNCNATCFTKYYELQFEKGKMMGMKIIEYLLEKSRVSCALDDGYSFHIFYHLLNGATVDERKNLYLSDVAHFKYLNTDKMKVSEYFRTNDPEKMTEIRDTLKSFGIGNRYQTEIWKLLSAILHIGNINFQESNKSGEPCTVKNFAQLQIVSDILGLTPSSLQSALTSRIVYLKGEGIASYLGVDDAQRF